MQRLIAFLLLFLGAGMFGLLIYAIDSPSVDPGPESRCPVCGMFVAKYPNWIAQVEFRDKSAAFFDGPKDLFRYLLNLQKYRPDSSPDDVTAVFVTDYYAARRVQARSAYFVIGSDVKGPMGKELVPFETEEAASEFMSDHGGERILNFSQVDQECIDGLK